MAFKKHLDVIARVTTALPCARPGCKGAATISHQGENLCREHLAEQSAQDAAEWCKAHGLTTREEKYQFCRGAMARFGKFPVKP